MKEELDYVDVEPLLIFYYVENEKFQWVHPFINDYFKPSTLSEEECKEYDIKYNPEEIGYDDNVYRMYLENPEGQTVYVVFKSNYVNQRLEKFNEIYDLEEGLNHKADLFSEEFIDGQEVFESLCTSLFDDVWIPGPIPKEPIKNSRDYAAYRNSFESEQFCFSEFGEKLSEIFKGGVKCNFFSLDCGLTHDGKGDWWFDS